MSRWSDRVFSIVARGPHVIVTPGPPAAGAVVRTTVNGGPCGAHSIAADGTRPGLAPTSWILAAETRDGEGQPGEEEDPTVGVVLVDKKGTILRAPLPKGSPSWEDVRGTRMSEVRRRAAANEPGYRTIAKLLTDRRFDR